MAGNNVGKSYVYNNGHEYSGKVLIFTHSVFSNTGLPELPHTEADYKRIASILEEAGFKIDRYSNLKRNDVLKKLKEAAMQDILNLSDMFMCIFLTHGDSDQRIVYASDCEINIKEIQEMFMAEKCSNLIGKPKFFVFQASDIRSQTESDGPGDEIAPKTRTLPAESDFLIYTSSMPDGQFFWDANPAMGTLFSRAFSEQLEVALLNENNSTRQPGEPVDFKDVFYNTNCRVAQQLDTNYPEKFEQNGQILPRIDDSITKSFFFKNKSPSDWSGLCLH